MGRQQGQANLEGPRTQDIPQAVYYARRTGRHPSADRTESTCMKFQFKVLTNLLFRPPQRIPGMT